jgi:adenylate cyclase
MVGDNLLAEFKSPLDAIECALEIQRQLALRNAELEAHRQMHFRVGINVGDLMIDGERIVGDGVNIAARIEASADPGGIAISGSVMEQIEGKLPLDIEDTGAHELKNVRKPVHIYKIARADEQTTRTPKPGARDDSQGHVPGFAGRHAVAVLPFRNLSRDEDQAFFADGLTEDIISSLAALKTNPVISRNSTFAYKDKHADPRTIGKELGAHYVVTGSVRNSGKRVRVTAELADAFDGHQVWSGRYDRELDDFFDLQDELTMEIAGALGPALSHSEMRHAMRRQPKNLDAWDCIHRGMWHLFERTRQDMKDCRSWARRALELQPDSAQAWSLMAFSRMYDILYQWTDDPVAAQAEIRAAAERAVALDKDDTFALIALGYSLSMAEDHDRAIAVLERAVEGNPSSALGYWALGSAMRFAGRFDEAIPMIQKAIRLSPQDRMLHEFYFTLASAHFLAGRYVEAVNAARHSLNLVAGQPGAWRIIAASQAFLGQLDDARASLSEMVRLAPGLTGDAFRSFMPDHIADKYVAGLKLAGWPG